MAGPNFARQLQGAGPVVGMAAGGENVGERPAAKRAEQLRLTIPVSALYGKINVNYPLIRAMAGNYVDLDGEALSDFINYINSKGCATL